MSPPRFRYRIERPGNSDLELPGETPCAILYAPLAAALEREAPGWTYATIVPVFGVAPPAPTFELFRPGSATPIGAREFKPLSLAETIPGTEVLVMSGEQSGHNNRGVWSRGVVDRTPLAMRMPDGRLVSPSLRAMRVALAGLDPRDELELAGVSESGRPWFRGKRSGAVVSGDAVTHLGTTARGSGLFAVEYPDGWRLETL